MKPASRRQTKKMPRNRDEVDNMSLGAHHLLHRSCRGKAHASGIAKKHNRQDVLPQKIPKSPAQDFSKQHEFSVSSNGVTLDRKHSRNSTSSWECSDSDSMHSSEIGQNGCPENRTVNSNRGLERTPSIRYNAKERSKGNNQCSPSLRASKSFKKESWADTLRVGSVNDNIKKMEKGWDDSNVIRTPKERKWHRITAEIEQRIPCTDNGLRMFGFKNSWANNSKKVTKRSRPGHQRCAKPIQDIIEWEELFEMALARKIRRGIRENGKVGSNVTKSVKSDGENRAKDEGECMKRLEVLLESRVTPQTDEVRFMKDSKEIDSFISRLLRSPTKNNFYQIENDRRKY